MSLPIVYVPEVREALDQNKPVVALESTIISHGMPYPQNVEMATMIENTIRENGATPATIAVIDGKITIGMSSNQLESFGKTKCIMKLSRADIAYCIASNSTGATTVAATMICANIAGISVFATGGIGGVHRGAEDTFDISADLEELAQTSVIVVAAGAKAILDIPKTLEVLETKGVPVITVGQDEFPAFWSRKSGYSSPMSSASPLEIAKTFQTRRAMDISGGLLVANPIPEEDEIPSEVINPIIEDAIEDAKQKNILAKDVTPFLLQNIFDRTNGLSLKANIALVRNNAKFACDIAKTLQ